MKTKINTIKKTDFYSRYSLVLLTLYYLGCRRKGKQFVTYNNGK